MGTHLYKLPDIGEGVVEAEITAWHVAVGDRGAEEDPIADAMTDKATIELTSPVDGVVKSIACEEGDMLAVGAVLVSFEIEGEGDAPEPEPEVSVEPAQVLEPKPAIAPETKIAPQQTAPIVRKTTTGKSLASPAVRARAAQLNIDLSKVPAAAARVTHADLDAYLMSGLSAQTDASPSPPPQAKPSPASSNRPSSDGGRAQEIALVSGETRHKVIGLRRVIAKRMAESKRHIPHFTYVEEMDVTALEAMRARMNDRRSEDKPKLTVLPLIIRALAVTLVDWPQFNARYEDQHGYVARFEDLNLGIAAQTDGGLIVPVTRKLREIISLRQKI